jgi:glycosyltransferase involved in cell wall biosynthesis
MTADGLLLPSGDGATARFLETARALSRAGHDVTIMHCFRDWSCPQRLAAEPFRTVLVHPADFYWGKDLWRDLLGRLRPEVLQIHEEVFIASLLERDLVPPSTSLLFECHNAVVVQEGTARPAGEMPPLQTLFAATVADCTVCLTESEAESLRQGGAEAVTCIPCTISLPTHVKEHAGLGRDFAFLGHFYYEPNAEAARFIARELLPRITAQISDARAHFFGHAPEALRAELSGRNVVWHGFVDDPVASLATCDVALAPVVLGSGFRVKLLHYMAAGLPVVGTGIGVTGVGARSCFSVSSDARALADACVELARRADLRADRAATAYRILRDEFGTPGLVARYEALFRDLPRREGDGARFQRRIDAFGARFTLSDPRVYVRGLCTDRPPWLDEVVRKMRFDRLEPPWPPPGMFVDLGDPQARTAFEGARASVGTS